MISFCMPKVVAVAAAADWISGISFNLLLLSSMVPVLGCGTGVIPDEQAKA